MTTFGDLVYQLGGVPVGGWGAGNVLLAGGDVFFVNGGDGLAGNTGTRPDDAKKTITQAYNLTATNNNDVVINIGDSSGAQIGLSTDTSGLTWSNSRCHLIGACAPSWWWRTARIFHNFNASPIWTISGYGSSFENIYFGHGRGSTTNKIGVQIGGESHAFTGVHFAGPHHATDGNQTTYSVVTLPAASQGHTFMRCSFGTDTIDRGNGATSMTITGASAGSIQIVDSDFIARSSNAGATHMEISPTGLSTIILENVSMINHGTTMTQAIDSNIADTTNMKIIIKPPFFVVGATDVADATGDGTIWTQSFTSTANALGIGVNVAVT